MWGIFLFFYYFVSYCILYFVFNFFNVIQYVSHIGSVISKSDFRPIFSNFENPRVEVFRPIVARKFKIQRIMGVRPTYWSRHFSFSKSENRFVITNNRKPRLEVFKLILQMNSEFTEILYARSPYWIRHFQFWDSVFKFSPMTLKTLEMTYFPPLCYPFKKTRLLLVTFKSGKTLAQGGWAMIKYRKCKLKNWTVLVFISACANSTARKFKLHTGVMWWAILSS